MRILATALALLALAALTAPAARADGDPASDVLVAQDAFFPYAPPTQQKLRDALTGVLDRARDAGYPVKVALIASERDLGAYPTLYNRANDYATLLARELPANRHGPKLTGQRILVVMPGGFGGNNLGRRVDEALAPVDIQADAGADGLAVAAIEAVARLATVNGHEVAVPPEAGLRLAAADADDGGGGGPSPVVYLAPVLLIFAVLFILGRRRGTDDEPEPAEA